MMIEVKICGAKLKEKLSYKCHNTITITVEQLETLIWRYSISNLSKSRTCSAGSGLLQLIERWQYHFLSQGTV